MGRRQIRQYFVAPMSVQRSDRVFLRYQTLRIQGSDQRDARSLVLPGDS